MDPKTRLQLLRRKPYRISANFPMCVADWLFRQSATQGRSVSNLISHIVESAMRSDLTTGNGHQQGGR